MSPLSISLSFVARKTNKNHKRPQIYIWGDWTRGEADRVVVVELHAAKPHGYQPLSLSLSLSLSLYSNTLMALGLFGLVLSFGWFGDFVMKVWGFHLGLGNVDLWVSMCALLKLFVFFGMGLQFDLPFFSMFIWIENLEFLGNFLNFQNIVF